MSVQIQDRHAFTNGGVFSDVTTEQDSAWVSLAEARRVLFHVVTGNVDNGDTLSVQIQEAQDSSGTGAQDLGSATTEAADVSPSEALDLTIEKRADELSAGFTHVRCQVSVTGTSPVTAVAAGVSIVQGEQRFVP